MTGEYINNRSRKILNMIMAATDHISLEEIAAELKLSKRSIYYEICKINEWLSVYNLPELEITRGKGIYLEEKQKTEIENIIERVKEETEYIFSPMERVYVIICYIIHGEDPIYVEDLMKYCDVSRNTIFNDMKAVVNKLQEFDLKLQYDAKNGYYIIGDCIRVRAIFFLYFNILHPLFESGILKFIKKDQVDQYYRKLGIIENDLKTQYVDGILLSLAALMPMMQKNNSDLKFPDLKVEELKNTREFGLVDRYFPELCEPEKIYLSLHLLGSRISTASDDIFDSISNQSDYELAKALVAEFEKVACVNFEGREELERALFIHINASMYRYQYGIQIGNPMLNEIVREYPNLFDITRIVCKYLEQQVGLPIPDGEVAYLALHFGAYLKGYSFEDIKLRILIVCVNGISTGNMMKSEVAKLLPQAEIIDVVAASDFKNAQEKCDLVISTVKLRSMVPVIVVSPILKDFDRKNILNHPMVKRKMGIVDTTVLFDIVKKYVPKSSYKSLKRDLNEYLKVDSEYAQVPHDRELRGLCDFLNDNGVVITDQKFTWDQVIRFCGENMCQRGTISPEYIEKIISQIRYYGPYMFILPNVILAHAKPEDGVFRLDISMTILKQGVQFSDFHNARIVMILAAEDQERHLRILKNIQEIFSIPARVDKLMEMNDSAEVLQYLTEILDKS